MVFGLDVEDRETRPFPMPTFNYPNSDTCHLGIMPRLLLIGYDYKPDSAFKPSVPEHVYTLWCCLLSLRICLFVGETRFRAIYNVPEFCFDHISAMLRQCSCIVSGGLIWEFLRSVRNLVNVRGSVAIETQALIIFAELSLIETSFGLIKDGAFTSKNPFI